ncbi:MAG: HAMP domain-containing histidine kinase [Bacteroidales bacterium]|nr:HAMP domain-containing histidine kinase [Bacteroidales bacterium]MCM1424635.1 HAMP domain-containing histidine kinase [bacterium]
MRAFGKVICTAGLLFAMIFLFTNLVLLPQNTGTADRLYRVESNRIARTIAENGLAAVDLSQYESVYHVEPYGDHFYNADADYLIREIDGTLYRFDYTAEDAEKSGRIVFAVNLILALVMAAVFALLFYIRAKILRPFEQMADIPYELAKGNLTPPVKEQKNRFFGKFLWGIDLLRENIEEQKRRELALQKEKKTLLLSLSHDIKTPLSAIKLYAKALSKNLYPDAARQIETAEKINEKADEIERYVSQIIAASREDFLSLTVENGEFYLSELIENITQLYAEKLTLSKTEFQVGSCRNCLLFGDLDRSVEVLQNMMENALKYGDGSRVELLFPDEDEGVLVSVRNSGCTLEVTELPHIFESFWRGANAGKIRGSGLGLYICRQLMHKMNGEIFAQIDGTYFTVTAVWGRG